MAFNFIVFSRQVYLYILTVDFLCFAVSRPSDVAEKKAKDKEDDTKDEDSKGSDKKKGKEKKT